MRGATVGIVGAGQLARMTLQAAIPLAIPIRLLAEQPDDGAALVAPDVTIGSPADGAALAAFAATCDLLTFDHVLVPAAHLQHLEDASRRLYPSAATMALAQDKRLQRERFAAAGLPVPPFRVVGSPADAVAFGNDHGWPMVLKAARAATTAAASGCSMTPRRSSPPPGICWRVASSRSPSNGWRSSGSWRSWSRAGRAAKRRSIRSWRRSRSRASARRSSIRHR